MITGSDPLDIPALLAEAERRIMGATALTHFRFDVDLIRALREALVQVQNERDAWKEDARNYCANADFHRGKREAAEAALAAQGWQDIATAPKMRKILVHYRNALGKDRCVMACYYKSRSLMMHDDYADVGEYGEETGDSYAPEGWYEEHDSDNPMLPLEGEPTHWQPLPPPPETQP